MSDLDKPLKDFVAETADSWGKLFAEYIQRRVNAVHNDKVDSWMEMWRSPAAFGGGWGFGFTHDRRSVFSSDDARDAYLAHCRGCSGHHDARGITHSKCPDLDPAWFATDAAMEPD